MGGYVFLHIIYIFFSDPPDVSVEGTATPAQEYTTRNITCTVNGGNPSDLNSYTYEWMYRPFYATSTAYISVQPGI